MSDPVIAARGWSKSFAGTTVLRDVDLDVAPGEVHALLGQNGSGKSTFIKILCGYHDPDPGAELTVRGEPVSLPLAPGDPLRLRFATVHQDLALVDEASVVENLRIDSFEGGFGRPIRWRRERARTRKLLERYGLDVEPATPVAMLREGQRATLALIRALDQLGDGERGLLVLDEPTAYLPHDGVRLLFSAVRQVTAHGVGVLFVTHRLDEVREIADTVTVLRDGARVFSGSVAELTDDQLITHIVGTQLEELYPEPKASAGSVAMSVDGLTSSMLDSVSFTVDRGEILGVTGLIGMGWEELPYVLAGAQPAYAGTLTIAEDAIDVSGLSVRAALAHGISLVPANRKRDAIVADATVIENVTLPTLSRHWQGGRLRRREERARVNRLIERYDIRPADPDCAIGTLSGGNQQKAVMARWMEARTRVLLMHEPTQGVDVGARRHIFQLVREAAQQGTAMLFASSESEDLANMCDRVLVFRNGRIAAELSGDGMTEQRIVEQSLRRG